MMKHILASTALATLLATSVYAQDAPTADPAADPASPVIEGADGAAMPMAEPTAPDIAQDTTVTPDAATPPEMVEEVAPMDGQADTLATEEVVPMADDGDTMTADGAWAPVDLATFSADRLIGADIVTADDETVASIEDVLLNDDGSVANIVAKFGGFLGFGANQVLLTMDEIEVMQDSAENLLVRTSLTPESIEARPVYED